MLSRISQDNTVPLSLFTSYKGEEREKTLRKLRCGRSEWYGQTHREQSPNYEVLGPELACKLNSDHPNFRQQQAAVLS